MSDKFYFQPTHLKEVAENLKDRKGKIGQKVISKHILFSNELREISPRLLGEYEEIIKELYEAITGEKLI